MKRFAAIAVCFRLCFPLFAGEQPALFKRADRLQMDHWVDSVFNTLTPDEKIGQLFMLVTGPSPSYRESMVKNIGEMKIGGILFSKGNLQEQAESTDLYQKKSRIPLLISFDGEWGLAMRLEDTPLFPRNMMLGAIQDNRLIRLYGEEMGRECRELGVHINFAPVLDVNINPSNPVIGSRSFGEDPQEVAEKGIAYASGLESRNVIAVAKHFPGHGDTSEDSHKTLPRISHSRERLEKVELYPFKQFIREGFSGVMTGHLSVPSLDNQTGLPTSLSSLIINKLLKEECGFEGLTVTDALAMKGATPGRHSICVHALLAGNDILLNPSKPRSEFEAVKNAVASGVIPRELIDKKCRKVLYYKYIAGLNNYQPVKRTGLRERVNSDYASWLVQKLNNEAVTLLKNPNSKIPLKEIGYKKIAVVSIGSEGKSAFQEHLSLYGDFDYFNISQAELQTGAASLFKKLKSYDEIICGIHHYKLTDISVLQSLSREKTVHCCFFISPYSLGKFRKSIDSAASVTLAYENTEGAQKAAAEVLTGGIPAKGKLPVTISSLYKRGEGLTTEKVRLSYQGPEEVNMSSGTLKKIENIVEEGIADQAFPGCQVLVARDGVIVYNHSFGHFDYSGKRAVRNDDLYDLASVTKAIATVPAIMKLIDDKQVSLDSRISRFVPELKGTDKEKITIRSALLHESGLPSAIAFYQLLIDPESFSGRLFSPSRDAIFRIPFDNNLYARTDYKFKSDLVSDVFKSGFTRKVAERFYVANDFPKRMLQEIANSTLRKNWGYLYSDLNFILLKEVVENVSELNFDDFIDFQFFAPLGARHTLFLPIRKVDPQQIAPTENDRFLRNQLLTGYPHDEAAAVMGGVSGNAGLFSNANDLAKMAQMLLNDGWYGGENYISTKTVKLFKETQSTISRRGLGFDRADPIPGKGPVCDRASASTFGHTGYTGTCFWIDPDERIVYIFLSNRVFPSRMHKKLMENNIRTRIQSVIYESIEN